MVGLAVDTFYLLDSRDQCAPPVRNERKHSFTVIFMISNSLTLKTAQRIWNERRHSDVHKPGLIEGGRLGLQNARILVCVSICSSL